MAHTRWKKQHIDNASEEELNTQFRMEPLIAFLIGIAVIILVELSIWSLFRQKAGVLLFPRDMDASHLRLLTLGTVRVAAIVHTLVLGVLFGIAVFNAW